MLESVINPSVASADSREAKAALPPLEPKTVGLAVETPAPKAPKPDALNLVNVATPILG